MFLQSQGRWVTLVHDYLNMIDFFCFAFPKKGLSAQPVSGFLCFPINAKETATDPKAKKKLSLTDKKTKGEPHIKHTSKCDNHSNPQKETYITKTI